MNGPGDGQVWPLGRDVAVCIRVHDGLTQVGVFPAKDRLPEFTAERQAAFDRFVGQLPDGPSLAGARRVSNLIGTTDYPCIRRDPAPRPGLALIGDAATAESLAQGRDLHRALRGYRRAHRFIDAYDALGRREALARPPGPLQRAVRAAAVSDPYMSRRLAAFAMRAAPLSVLLNPKVMIRAAVASRAPKPRGERPNPSAA